MEKNEGSGKLQIKTLNTHTMIDQKQLEKVECFNYLHSMITNYTR